MNTPGQLTCIFIGVHADATNADIIARSIDERDVTNVRRWDDYGNLVLLVRGSFIWRSSVGKR